MRMKIYFAGSIRGGREDRELYARLIRYIGRYGEVLTEHVGDPALGDRGEAGFTDASIYARDLSWIEGADAVVAEVTVPSIGVGYEIAKAESLHKKTLCLYREEKNKRLSAMISGNPNVRIARYGTAAEAAKKIDGFFESFR